MFLSAVLYQVVPCSNDNSPVSIVLWVTSLMERESAVWTIAFIWALFASISSVDGQYGDGDNAEPHTWNIDIIIPNEHNVCPFKYTLLF